MDFRQQFEQKLIEKAMKDESFRKQLIENPKEVIEAEFGKKIPESININVMEENAHTVYLILPQVSAQNSEMELTEAELFDVAGGLEYTHSNVICDYTQNGRC
jgi:hypothetical protein